MPFGLAALDSYLPEGGLACGALHEVVPETPGCIAAAFGFIAAILARLSRASPLFLVMPAYGLREYGRPHGHGLHSLGLDPARLILVETAHRKETLWAMEEALRSAAPTAVAGMIDKLDLKTSQRLHLRRTDAGLPLLLLRPAAPTLPSPTCGGGWGEEVPRQRAGASARRRPARDRFGLFVPHGGVCNSNAVAKRTAGRMGSGVRSCRASFQFGCRAGRSCVRS